MEANRRSSKRPATTRRQKPGTGLATCALSVAILAMLGYAVVKRQQVMAAPQQLANSGANADQLSTPVGSDQRMIRAELTAQQLAPLPQLGALRSWPPMEPIGLESPTYEQPYPQWVPLGPSADSLADSTAESSVPEVASEDADSLVDAATSSETINSVTDAQMTAVLEELGSYKLSSAPESSLAQIDPDSTTDAATLVEPTLSEPELAELTLSDPQLASLPEITSPEFASSADEAAPLPEVVSLDGANLAEQVVDTRVVIENKFAQTDEQPVYVEPKWPTTTLPPEEVASMPAPPIPAMPFMFDAPASETNDVSTLAADQLPEQTTEPYADEIEDAIFDDVEAQMAHDTPIEELLNDTPTTEQVGKLAAKDVREAFNLGRHGALYAARGRFIAVLRQIALAKDAEGSTDRHSVALAAGIRALDEAADFIPSGDALATDMDVHSIAQSHTTPLLRDAEQGRWALPHEAIARYHRYAQHKLALAVAGDQAGSMALHGLGKSYARLAALGEAPEAQRTSLTMYRSAVMAHDGNYLAANELGVGLAKAGRYESAEKALQKAIAGGAKSTVYANLAIVQQKLGQTRLAQASNSRATQLASNEMAAGEFSRERGVKWMDPAAFARVSGAMDRQAPARNPNMPQNVARQPVLQQRIAAPIPRQQVQRQQMPRQQSTGSPMQQVRPRVAVRAPVPPTAPQKYRSGMPAQPTGPAYQARHVQNPTMPPVRSQTIVR